MKQIEGVDPKSRVLRNTDIRLIDFGSATFEQDYHSNVVCTRHYRAPEIILGLGWSYPCDIWSIGCILVEFLTGDALFQTHDNLEHLAMMTVVLGKIPAKLIKASSFEAQKFFKDGKLRYPADDTTKQSRKYVRALKLLKVVFFFYIHIFIHKLIKNSFFFSTLLIRKQMQKINF